MKTKLLLCSVFVFLIIMGGCLIDSEVSGKPGKKDDIKYAAEFRGEWIRMDTGDRWYINGNSIKENGNASGLNVSLTRKSGNVVIAKGANNQQYVLFAARVASASFNANVVHIGEDGISSNIANRSSRGTTGQKSSVKIINPAQPDQIITAEPDVDTGDIKVDGVIPGDKIEIVPDDSVWNDVPIVVTPGYGDDQDLGIIPLAKGMNHKAAIRMANPNDNIYDLYADNVARNYIIDVGNVGTSNSTGASYSITFDQNDFEYVSGLLNGPLNTLVPGARREIPITLRSKQIENESKIKKINIQIKYVDVSGIKEWNDVVSINYFRQSVPFYIRSQNSVQGIIKTPRGEANYFKTVKSGNDYAQTVNVPWSKDDYVVTFLGATEAAGSETVYSLGIGETPSNDWNSLFDSGKQYEYYGQCENENSNLRLDLEDNKTFMYYLYSSAEQYFRINLGKTPSEPYQVTFNINGGSIIGGTENNFQVNVNVGAGIILPDGREYSHNALYFNGWNTESDGSGMYYRAGSIFKPRGDCILFAQWSEKETFHLAVGNVNDWNEALNVIRDRDKNETDLKTYIINVNGNFSIPGNIGISGPSYSFGDTHYIDVILTGSGTITLNSKGSILIFSTDQKLIIDGENLILQGFVDNNYPVIYVVNGTLELHNGTISGNTTSGSGGGVSVISGGNFIMTGGTISGNAADNGGGGIDFNSDGKFTMTGGIIHGNTAGIYGGGVSVGGMSLNGVTNTKGTFVMSGGIIRGNSAQYGGGLYCWDGLNEPYSSFSKTKAGGIIYGNNEGNNSNISAKSGGHAACWVSSDTYTYHRNSTLWEFNNINTERTDGWERQ